MSAGGCSNFGTYGRNPAWAIKIPIDTDVLFRLLAVDNTNITAAVHLYRVNSTYPVPPDAVSINSLSNSSLATSNGTYN